MSGSDRASLFCPQLVANSVRFAHSFKTLSLQWGKLMYTHPLKHAELSQGKRNKNKWAWSIKHSIDKADAGLVQWYADKLLSLCTVMEGMKL